LVDEVFEVRTQVNCGLTTVNRVDRLLELNKNLGCHSGEAWRLFKEAYHEREFSDSLLEVSLNFSICSFDLSSFFLLCDGYTLAATASCSQSFVKTEPLSSKTGDYDFAYASDTAENNGRDHGHIVELSY
jgi:hypothetical protein